jgi:hypothetical protein
MPQRVPKRPRSAAVAETLARLVKPRLISMLTVTVFR